MAAALVLMAGILTVVARWAPPSVPEFARGVTAQEARAVRGEGELTPVDLRARAEFEGGVEADSLERTTEPRSMGLLVIPKGVTQLEEGTLRVWVRSRETGAPVAGVSVKLLPYGRPDGAIDEAETNEEGWTDCQIPLDVPHQAVVWAWHRDGAGGGLAGTGGGDVQVPALTSPDLVEVTIEVATRPMRFVGRVVAADTRDPVADASVVFAERLSSWIYRDGKSARQEPSSVRANVAVDPDGYFELELLPWVFGVLEITAEGFGLAATVPVNGCESRARAREVPLARSGTLDVTVFDQDGLPAQRAEVVLEVNGYRLTALQLPTAGTAGVVAWKALTGDDGECALVDLPTRVPLAVRHLHPGGSYGVHPPIVLEPGQRRELVLGLGGATLRGALVDVADDPGGVEVWLKPSEPSFKNQFQESDGDDVRRTRTEPDGQFEFERVADGTWWVGLSPRSDYPPRAQIVQVEGGVADRTLLFEVLKGRPLSGIVLDPTGTPVEGANVWARGDGILAQGPTDGSGSFSLGVLPPGLVEVGAWVFHSGFAKAESVEARAGDDDVVLRLRPGGEIRGSLVDARSGEPAEGQVWLMASDGPRRMKSARDSGQFAFLGLEPGTYHVIGITEADQIAVRERVSAVIGAEAATITLLAEPGARIRLRFEQAVPGATYKLFGDGVLLWSGTCERGAVPGRVVPAGSLRIEYYRDSTGTPEVREVSLAAGEEREIVLGQAE